MHTSQQQWNSTAGHFADLTAVLVHYAAVFIEKAVSASYAVLRKRRKRV